ncbi:MAG: branched-chain amino acid ABC transporter ATP-binding protein/permease, partial [Actinomycetota bacterium]|nr:branched-chain amino acid ABC transporter ATP-binding protein/permease [Actinomycetota bacterium]
MYYLIILLVYAAVDAIACLGLSQQFGISGVTNFGFIIFQAVGAYVAAVLALPPDTANGGFQLYIGGFNLAFPLPWIGAAVAGGLLALPFTFLVGRRLRGDFAAIGLLVTAVLMNLLATNYRPLFNGAAGVAVVPTPFQSGVFVSASTGYQFGFAIGAIILAGVVFWFVRRLTESPYGRTLRAMRDNDLVADSLGKNLFALRTGALVIGGAIAALSGAILVDFISVWSPAEWGYAETIVLFTAVIIGGTGNHIGAVLGAVIVPVGFEEITRFITNSNPNLPPNLLPSLQWVAIGLLIVVFLWVRPQGLLPERRRVVTANGRRSAAATGSTGATGPAMAGQPAAGAAAAADLDVAAGARTVAAVVSGGRDRVHRSVSDDPVILRTEKVSREFGGVHAVADVSVSIRRGTLTGLIGPNGAGKSTFLSLLAGTQQVSGGRIIYQDRDVTAMPAYLRARAGLVRTFQLASEFKRLTVMENLLSAVPGHRGDSFAGAMLGRRYWRRDEVAAIARAEALIESFGLTRQAHQYAGDLSGGQRRLVEIMRALMTEPDMLLLDEPMAGVHPELARRIGESLVRLCQGGMTILMVEHELAIMDEFCDPVVVMADGSLLAEGT